MTGSAEAPARPLKPEVQATQGAHDARIYEIRYDHEEEGVRTE